jgi:hypothetical protein
MQIWLTQGIDVLSWIVENVALIFSDLAIFGVPCFAKATDGAGGTIIVIHGLKSKIKLDESTDGKPRHSYCNTLDAKVGACT